MTFRDFMFRIFYLNLSLVFICSYEVHGNVSYSDWMFKILSNDQNSSYYCPVGPEPFELAGIKKVAESFEFVSCFENKKSNRNFINEPTAEENKELIKGDLKICDCLSQRASKNDALAKLFVIEGVKKLSRSEIEETARRNYEEAYKEAGTAMFDASIVSNNDRNFTSVFYSDSVNGATNKKSIAPVIPSPLMSTEFTDEQQTEDLRSVYRSSAVGHNLEKDSKSYYESLLEDKEMAPGQCVTGREFIAFNQKKSFEKVSKELSELDLDNFNPDDWNFKKLKSEYDDLMLRSPAVKNEKIERITLLKNRILFLNYNPLVKTFLTINPLSAEAREAWQSKIGRNGRDTNDIKYCPPNYYEEQNIKSKKKDLLKILKNYVGGSKPGTCNPITRTCTERVIDQASLEKYNKDLRDFFTQAHTGAATSKQSEILSQERLYKRDNFDENKLELIQKDFVNSYLKDFPGVGHPDECGVEVDPEKCPKIYAGYCKKITAVRSKLETDDRVPNDLEGKLKNSFNPDFNTNEDLRAFNKEMCDTKIKTNRGEISFNEYKKNKCKKGDLQKMLTCRDEFFLNNSKESLPLSNEFLLFARNSNISKVKISFRELLNSRFKLTGTTNPWVEMRESFGLSRISDDEWGQYGDYNFSRMSSDESNILPPIDGTALSKIDPTEFSKKVENLPFVPDYSQGALADSSEEKSDKEKIEKMNDDKKKQLLSDWEKEYDDWRKSKNVSDTNQLSPVDAARDESLKKEIQTLRSLLEDQKKLTASQSKLLNDAIQRRSEESSASSPQKMVPRKENSFSDSSSFNQLNRFATQQNFSNSDISRNPSSVADSAKLGNSSSATNAARNSSSLGKASKSSENPDSLAREQAKLVNIRNFADGSIMVDSGPNSSPNAITLPVSDEQYQQLLLDPSRFSLSQIEKSIPADQIRTLEKSGEIILLLKNGSKPPLEVRVERKDNKLVYRNKDDNGKDQKPVRRVFTLKALENNLR